MPPSQTGSNATSPSRRPAARCSRRELIVEASEKLLLSDANAGLCVGAAGGSIIGLTIVLEKFANRFGKLGAHETPTCASIRATRGRCLMCLWWLKSLTWPKAVAES